MRDRQCSCHPGRAATHSHEMWHFVSRVCARARKQRPPRETSHVLHFLRCAIPRAVSHGDESPRSTGLCSQLLQLRSCCERVLRTEQKGLQVHACVLYSNIHSQCAFRQVTEEPSVMWVDNFNDLFRQAEHVPLSVDCFRKHPIQRRR